MKMRKIRLYKSSPTIVAVVEFHLEQETSFNLGDVVNNKLVVK